MLMGMVVVCEHILRRLAYCHPQVLGAGPW